MKIYLAGAMTGIKHFNRDAFASAASHLREQGHTVFSPPEYAETIYGPKVLITNENGDQKEKAENFGFDNRKVLANELAYICLDAEVVVYLPNSENSKGTKAELAVAEALGIPVHEWSKELEL